MNKSSVRQFINKRVRFEWIVGNRQLCPRVCDGIINFRNSGICVLAGFPAAHHDNSAIGQGGGGWVPSRIPHFGKNGPGIARRVENLCVRNSHLGSTSSVAPNDKNSAVRQCCVPRTEQIDCQRNTRENVIYVVPDGRCRSVL